MKKCCLSYTVIPAAIKRTTLRVFHGVETDEISAAGFSPIVLFDTVFSSLGGATLESRDSMLLIEDMVLLETVELL